MLDDEKIENSRLFPIHESAICPGLERAIVIFDPLEIAALPAPRPGP